MARRKRTPSEPSGLTVIRVDAGKEPHAERKFLWRLKRERIRATFPRPLCAFCRKPLPLDGFSCEQDKKVSAGRVWGYGGNNVFCTLKCGFSFGLASHRAGFRMKGQP